ncbi:MAG TPA: hypothetical protein VGC96_01665 [Candidatus Elarobacter sp.]
MLLASVAIAAQTGCGGGGGGGSQPATVSVPPVQVVTVAHSVLPAATDPAISNAFDAHLAIAPSPATSPLLVVFLPGTNGTPAGYTRIAGVAAAAGAHAIGLSYPDTSALLQDCGDDPDCYLPIRLQKFDGILRSPVDAVAPADAILNRLTKLLLYLDAHFPGEGWGAFVSGGAPVWSSIVVAGHSQGAGEAAAIAKVVRVARVAQFSGTVDAVVTARGTLAPATWVSPAGATPASAFYGFDHTADQFYAKIRIDWTALGQDAFGSAVTVESASPPYAGSHELITSLGVLNPHVSTAGDGASPVDANGVPVFAPVWRYVLGV